MIVLNKNKKAISVIACISVCIICLFSAFTEKKTPVEQTKDFCLSNIKAFQSQLDTFQTLVQQPADKKILIERFKKMRVDFKRIEFILEYIDGKHYPLFNGVNAVEMDDGFNPNMKPEGLQVIESELSNDTLDMERILTLTKQLKYRTLSFFLMLKDAQLKDVYVFEAIRFNLIRVEALSLVSFDSPDIRNNVEEIKTGFKTFNTILSFYKEDKNANDFAALKTKLNDAVSYLNTKKFATLDRLFFIKAFIQPIVKDVTNIQQKLDVAYLEASFALFRAVNLKAKTIYDTDFLNTKFYAQDKYYKNNPLYAELGKKLFFDKRLSVDNSLSCASCHQPANFFADNLPTAITNKTGSFQKNNSPTLLNAALQAGYFFDLSATTLETQINHVVLNPEEFNNNFDEILKRLQADTQYVRLFTQAFPEYKSDAISIYAISTCISDFERKLIFLNSPFDQYMRGQTSVIDPSVKRGFNLFMGKAQCGSCHYAPTFFGTVPPFYGTTESEVLGTPKVFDTLHPVLDEDIGRFKIFEYEPFRHSFKTSTVRNAALTGPYMHNGGFKTLDDVIEFYNRGGGIGLGLDVPNQTLPPDKLNLSKQDKKDIISFIKALTDTTGVRMIVNSR